MILLRMVLSFLKIQAAKIYIEGNLTAINSLVAKQREECPEEAYDSVRGVFFEGSELYPTSGFREKDHIQISIINPNCIKAFFKLRKEDKKYKLV